MPDLRRPSTSRPAPRPAQRAQHTVHTPARASDPDTSHDAARDTGMVRQAQRNQLLRAFRDAGRGGLTDEQAAKIVGLFETKSCWWHRASDLRADKLIRFTRHRRPGESGRGRRVSVITETGMKWRFPGE